jgi:hypothetical protein
LVLDTTPCRIIHLRSALATTFDLDFDRCVTDLESDQTLDAKLIELLFMVYATKDCVRYVSSFKLFQKFSVRELFDPLRVFYASRARAFD